MSFSSNFESEVSNGVVLVDFWAEWCPHCVSFMPHLDTLSSELSGKARVLKVNVTEAEELAHRFGITSLPTFLIFKNGEHVDTVRGAANKIELKRRVLDIVE
jgi:thioredoxin 1